MLTARRRKKIERRKQTLEPLEGERFSNDGEFSLQRQEVQESKQDEGG